MRGGKARGRSRSGPDVPETLPPFLVEYRKPGQVSWNLWARFWNDTQADEGLTRAKNAFGGRMALRIMNEDTGIVLKEYVPG